MTSEQQNLQLLRRRRRSSSSTVTRSDQTKKMSFTHSLTAQVLYENSMIHFFLKQSSDFGLMKKPAATTTITMMIILLLPLLSLVTATASATVASAQ
jgi:hypothetical protein